MILKLGFLKILRAYKKAAFQRGGANYLTKSQSQAWPKQNLTLKIKKNPTKILINKRGKISDQSHQKQYLALKLQ